MKLDEDFMSVAFGQEHLIELLVYNYLLDIDETAKYSDFSITEGLCTHEVIIVTFVEA